MVEPLIALRFLSICTLTKDEYKKLKAEVVADHTADPGKVGTAILARLLKDNEYRYYEVKEQIEAEKVEAAREKNKKTIDAVTDSWMGHTDCLPSGECPCFTKGDPKFCSDWQVHIDMEIDRMREERWEE